MRLYFTSLRSLKGTNTDKSDTVKALREGISGCRYPFAAVAEKFHMIDDVSKTVYIPIGDGEAMCRPLAEGTANKSDYRAAGRYSVSIYEGHYRALLSAGDIIPLTEDSAILINLRLYDAKKGLSMISETGKGHFI